MQLLDRKVICDVVKERAKWSVHDMTKAVSSGYFAVNHKLGGYRKGEVYVLAARPGMGKSAFAYNLTEQVAVRDEGCVVYLTSETPIKLIVTRMGQLLSGKDCKRFRIFTELMPTCMIGNICDRMEENGKGDTFCAIFFEL